jgi:hypothetical protein
MPLNMKLSFAHSNVAAVEGAWPVMEYDGRVAGIGVGAGKEGDMGRSGQIGGGGKRGVLM